MDTLNTFFNIQKGSSDWVYKIQASQEYPQAKQLIAKELTNYQVSSSFYELLLMKLFEAMDIEIGKILVGGWQKLKEIAYYRDKENPPDGYHKVTLLEHTLVSKHAPTIQPVINQIPLAKFKFDIILKLKMNTGKLFIRDGMIIKVTTGTCIGSGSIEFEGYKLLEKKTGVYDLPGEIPFDPGIPI